MLSKRIPLRMCVVCYQMKEKTALLRIAKSKEGELSIDLAFKKVGRGIYICKDKECIQIVLKGKKYDKLFQGNLKFKLLSKIEGKLEEEDGSESLRNA